MRYLTWRDGSTHLSSAHARVRIRHHAGRVPHVVTRRAVRWPIGCFNRPWTKWAFDDALRQIKAAGYDATGLLTRTKDEPFIAAEATPEYLAGLQRRLAASGLKAQLGALRSRHDIPLADSITEVRRQIDNAKRLD
jgi:sugar phosphate isomerase/epimerase